MTLDKVTRPGQDSTMIHGVQQTFIWMLIVGKAAFVLALSLGIFCFIRRLWRNGIAASCPGCSITLSVTAVNVIYHSLWTLDVLLDNIPTLPFISSEAFTCFRQLCVVCLLSFLQLVNFVFLLYEKAKPKFCNGIQRKMTFRCMSLTWVISILYYSVAYFFTRIDSALKPSSITLLTFSGLDINMIMCREDLNANWNNIIWLQAVLVAPIVVAVTACLIDFLISHRADMGAVEQLQEADAECPLMAGDPGQVQGRGAIIRNKTNHPKKWCTQLQAQTRRHIPDQDHTCIYKDIQDMLLPVLSLNVLWQVFLRPAVMFCLSYASDHFTNTDIGSDIMLESIVIVLLYSIYLSRGETLL